MELKFVYGTMNCGKTASLIMTAHSYTSANKKVLILKPSIDTRAVDAIKSRALGILSIDFTIYPDDNLYDINTNGVSCILVDEAQFLTRTNIIGLRYHSLNVLVICYGLKTDYMGNLFEGSQSLIELADVITEISRVCSMCDKKALINGKYINKKPDETVFIKSGSKDPDIGGNEKYMPVCWQCWTKN